VEWRFSPCLLSALAQANLSDDVIGDYSGAITDESSGGPGCNETETTQMVLGVTKTGTNSFKGMGTITGPDFVDTVVLIMTGPTPTTFSFTWTRDDVGGGFSTSGSGSLLDNAISLNASSSEIGGNNCTITFSGTLTRTGGPGAEQAHALQNTTEAVVQFATNTVASAGTQAVIPKDPNDPTNVSNGLAPIAGEVRYQGMSAGDRFEFPFGLWASYDHSDFDDDTGGQRP